MIDLPPTFEQEDALGLFSSGVNMAIEAGAGTGKTTTLAMLADDRLLSRGAYVVFNRAAAMDAQKRFPARVGCSTINSLAARNTDRAILNRLDSQRQPSWVAAKHLGISSAIYFTVNGKGRTLAPAWLGGYVLRALRQFCYSDRPEPSLADFVPNRTLDAYGETVNNDDLALRMLPFLHKAWADVQRPDGQLRYQHDHYVKAWALTDPQLAVDYLLVDEAQDLSPVQIGVFARQDCQVVWVGDSSQQIYAWRGAENALDLISADVRTYLSRSFRFGPPIAWLANLVLDRLPTELRLTGDDRMDSRVALTGGAASAVLCRTNAVAVEKVLNYQAAGVPVHLVGGGGEVLAFATAAERLQSEGRCDHPEIGCFDSWQAVQEYVAQDPLGDELKLLVDLVDKFGAEKIMEALDDMLGEDKADVIVSTAHKAKGREWGTVALTEDFPELADAEDEDLRLFYVAVTRARFVIDPFHTEMYHSLTKETVM